MGPPGAGKGTVCSRIVNEYNYKLICAGDLLREEKASGSELGNEIASIIDKGNLVPDEMITEIIFNEMSKPLKSGTFFLIDGYPRTIGQANDLERGKTSGRPDDANIEVIKKRIQNYNEISAPLKDFYGKRVIEINGEGTPDEVYNEVIKNIIKL